VGCQAVEIREFKINIKKIKIKMWYGREK